jgi:hypothetical protein
VLKVGHPFLFAIFEDVCHNQQQRLRDMSKHNASNGIILQSDQHLSGQAAPADVADGGRVGDRR